MAPVLSDEFEKLDRVYLEKLRLAASVIIELGKDNQINGVFETELYVFRDRVDRALLHPATSDGLPRRDPAAADGSAGSGDPGDSDPAPETGPQPVA